MKTIKTATIRLNSQEVDYVRLLQSKHREKYGVNISQSDLFRLLLKKEADKVLVDKEEIKLRDDSLMQGLRSAQEQKEKKTNNPLKVFERLGKHKS